MKSHFKLEIFIFVLILAVCLLGPGEVKAVDEVSTIGTMVAGQGATSKTFLISEAAPRGGVLKNLTITVNNGSQVPALARGNPAYGSRHSRPPRSFFVNSPRTMVASATVTVNGEKVFLPRDFNANVVTLTKTLSELPEGLSEVALLTEINGNEGSFLTITLTGLFEVSESGRVRIPWYLDRDGDGFGMVFLGSYYPDSPPVLPSLYTAVTVKGDCNDNDPNVYPGTITCPIR